MKAITTTLLPGGMSLEERVVATDCDGNSATFHVSETPARLSSHDCAAKKLAQNMGLKGTLVSGVLNNGNVVYVWDDPSCRLEVK